MTHELQHLYLTGYRGSGKSSVAKWLAAKLNRPVVDLDDRVEQAAGITIRELFAREGEPGFRDRESAALCSVSQEPPSIVALGGGAILREENRRVIAATGYCVWLQANAETILQRMKHDATTGERRPALTALPPREEVLELLAAREPLYAQVASLAVAVNSKTIEQIGSEIIAAVKSRNV